VHEPGNTGLGPPDTVFLHIGLPKTGTTFLQSTLSNSRKRLASAGVLVPGRSAAAQTLAVWDLIGRRPRGSELASVPGSWQALVDEVAGWGGSHAVVSEELLAAAGPAQIRRAVKAFAPAQVHVVVTIRDLGRVLTAAWQQELAKGRHWTWTEFLAAVRDPESGPATAGVAFWLRQDAARVLERWAAVVPHSNVHVVTVPPPGAPRDLLLHRFAEAVRIDPACLEVADGDPASNVSVGMAEAEVLRQLNLGLGGRLNERQYTRLVNHAVKPALQRRRASAPIVVPDDDRAWVGERCDAMVRELEGAGYHVLGSLDDLRGAPNRSVDGSGATEPAPAEMVDAAVAALVSVSEAYATSWWRSRRQQTAVATTRSARLASWGRSVAFSQQARALELADRYPLLRRAAVRYLRRPAG
jgi:hypothetical protein